MSSLKVRTSVQLRLRSITLTKLIDMALSKLEVNSEVFFSQYCNVNFNIVMSTSTFNYCVGVYNMQWT